MGVRVSMTMLVVDTITVLLYDLLVPRVLYLNPSKSCHFKEIPLFGQIRVLWARNTRASEY
jgi:hypothetical protein